MHGVVEGACELIKNDIFLCRRKLLNLNDCNKVPDVNSHL